jgi:hypothetical protein
MSFIGWMSLFGGAYEIRFADDPPGEGLQQDRDTGPMHVRDLPSLAGLGNSCILWL